MQIVRPKCQHSNLRSETGHTGTKTTLNCGKFSLPGPKGNFAPPPTTHDTTGNSTWQWHCFNETWGINHMRTSDGAFSQIKRWLRPNKPKRWSIFLTTLETHSSRRMNSTWQWHCFNETWGINHMRTSDGAFSQIKRWLRPNKPKRWSIFLTTLETHSSRRMALSRSLVEHMNAWPKLWQMPTSLQLPPFASRWLQLNLVFLVIKRSKQWQYLHYLRFILLPNPSYHW